MRLRAVLLSLAVMALALPGFGQTPLIADLSEHQIQITTGFVGTDVLLFGTVEPDSHVVVVVRGPEEQTTVWRKGRFAGIWVNDRRVVFERVPSFYAVRASAPLDGIASAVTRSRHGMGAEFLRLRAEDEAIAEAEVQVFREALIRNKQREGLFAAGGDNITFLGGQLFRTRLHFPANVPTGFYDVEVFMLKDGNVVHAQTTPLIVRKAGLGADVFFFAHNYSALYGIIAVLLAVAAGVIAAFVFRKS
ncbi:MAG: TIGR02186 family protein [Kiloniellaceae bacterium]